MNIQITNWNAKVKIIALIFFGVIAAVTVVWACGWSATTRHSVRFHSYGSDKEFSRLPPLPYQVDRKTGKSKYTHDLYEHDDERTYEQEEKDIGEIDNVWKQAKNAEMNGDYIRTAQLLQEYLHLSQFVRDQYFGPKNWQERRNTALDKLDALSALKHGSKADAVKLYLEARQKFYESTIVIPSAQEQEETKIYQSETSVSELLERGTTDHNLKDNYAYLRAAVLYKELKLDEARKAFDTVLHFPNSEKREAASFMAAVCAMKQSSLFVAASGDDEHRMEDRNANSTKPESKCCDEAWRDAKTRFTKHLQEYPQSRYRNNARGWLAYLYLRSGDRAQAMAEYYRLLGQQTDLNARVEAAVSLSLSRPHATESEMDQVESILGNEPAAALAYAYHNIYNYAIDPRCPLMEFYAGEYEQQSEVDKKRLSKENAALVRVAKFATQMMQRYPHAKVGGGFALRVAQANLESGDNQSARKLAQKALELGIGGEQREQALLAKGFAEHRMKDFGAARKTLNAYVSSYPQGKFSEDARRLLAMTAEDSGDLDAALEQYLALEYWQDVAYFMDVLLKPEQLTHFISNHPNLSQRDDLLYALGLRYMREEKWDEARKVFIQVRTVECRTTENSYGSSYTQKKINPKYDMNPSAESKGGICDCWVQKDLQTVKELQSLESGIEYASGDEAKAEAMYQYASHQYDSSRLTFYNSSAWHGGRYELLSSISTRATNESFLLFEYMQKHEPIARALPIYLDIVKRYPATKAARDALYTSAVIHERLSDYNPYWRNVYEKGLHPGERLVKYSDVKSAYPKYQLPRGTYGWEASTRTVNGGTGWTALPKPLPKLTRTQKFKHYLRRFTNAFQTNVQPKVDGAVESYTTYLWRCLYAVLIAFGLVFSWYTAVLGLHFWKLRKPVLAQELSIISLDDSPPPALPDSASRVEKIINEK